MTSRQSIQLNEQKVTSLAEAAVAKPSKRRDKSMKTTSMQSTSIIAPTHTREKTRLQPNQLTRLPNLDNIPASTRRIKPLNDFLGQQRARASVEAALSLPYDGYNIFAVGPSGLGKRTMLKRLLLKQAAQMPTPSDWVYVNNFADTRQPIALELPAGQGPKLKKAMHQLWQTMLNTLERRFTTDSYHARIETIRQATGQQQQDALIELTQEGEALDLRLISRNEEHRFVPVHHVEPPSNAGQSNVEQPQNNLPPELTEEEMAALAPSVRARIAQNVRQMDKKLEKLGSQLGQMEEQARAKVSTINRELASSVVEPKIMQIAQRFEHVNGLDSYLKVYAQDVITHVEHILAQDEEDFLPGIFDRVPPRYQVNVVVTHKPNSGAPVIFEDLPTHYNLLGHVEQLTQMGTITTDFTLIRSGVLHHANGGFLILEADQLLEQPYAWQGLKRALRSGHIKLSSLEHMITLTGSISIEPAAIPLQVKVVLLGEPYIYYELLEFEPELNSLFKIRADFTDTLPRNDENEQAYMRLIADYVQKEKLLPFDRSALAALLTDSSRQAEDQTSLSLHAATLGDLLREAAHLAASRDASMVSAQHIADTLEQRRYRLGYLRELYWQDLSRGTQLIETSGLRYGQINALTVVHYADSEFGLPARLTASVYQGGGDILDIERNVELGGSLHAKGILIMSSFLRSHFGRSQPLHFSAALAFEQSYGEIDGDSATLAELSALISAISHIPIDQSWSITGSMNQLGQVQPIGGINAKIEGFYDACKLQGLSGKQGVIFPVQNMQHLMLRQDVIEAVEQGKFHLHAIDTIEQALELLMDRPAGQIDAKGKYTKGSIYAEVMRQLKSWQVLESGEPEKDKKRKKKKSKSKKAGLQKQPVEEINEDSSTALNEAGEVKTSSSQPDEQGN
ncbi:ATP-binding protein [Alkanindiges illinoisensis]|uniref:endopeptidase La n=2 Tax=Alkanindiges illinoisensis TaxID=197183 RepID=A0A4Y7XFN9_9GAMM|nr:ATP-binding protein [Alkanindiges illinoisensis]